MSSLFGVSRKGRNKAVESVKRSSVSTSERFQSGLKQIAGSENQKVRLKSPHETFKLEAAFEARGTVYPRIRKIFILSIIVMCVLVLVRFFIVPQSLSDPNNPLRMDHHEYWTMVSHFVPSMCFLFGVFYQKESVQLVAENPKYLKYHRMVGRITAFSSMISSILAWRVTPYALHGTQMVYIPWNAFWNLASFKTIWYARKKDYSRHRLWANVLVHTAFLFVTSRLFIVLGAITGAPMKFVYVVAVNGAAFLAFFWYLLESGQWSRTVATRRRWKKLRTFVLVYSRLTKDSSSASAVSTKNKAQQTKLRICYGCNTEIASNVMKCENLRCTAFNDSAQGEYAQLLMDSNDSFASMPLRTTVERLSNDQDSETWSELLSLVAVPFLVIYFWMGLPLTTKSQEGTPVISFDALVGWHMIYTFLCVHMAAAMFKCFPVQWLPLANPNKHLLSPIWNIMASIAALVDAAFLYYCKANNLWIDQNPTWIVGLVVAFIPILVAPYSLTDRGMPHRMVRSLYLALTIVIHLVGYIGSTIASFMVNRYIKSGEAHSAQLAVGIMVALQLFEETMCQIGKGMIDAAKRDFGLDDETLPPEKRTQQEQAAVDNLETLFVMVDFNFGAYYFCFYRELWTVMGSTVVCLFVQLILLLQDFNMTFGGTVLRSVRVLVEGPILAGHQRDAREEATCSPPKDRRPTIVKDEFCVRLSKSELTESFRALSFKLMIRLISMAATPTFGLICRFGPNAIAFSSWSEMSSARFLTVLKNFGLMFVLEGFFVAAIVTSLYTFFRINLVRLLASTLLRSRLSRMLFVCSCIHLLQDLYVAIINMPEDWSTSS